MGNVPMKYAIKFKLLADCYVKYGITSTIFMLQKIY